MAHMTPISASNNDGRYRHYCPLGVCVEHRTLFVWTDLARLIWRTLKMHIEEDLLVLENEAITKGWQFAVASSILGWVLDAFDFFVVVFLFDALAGHFHVQKKTIRSASSHTLSISTLG